MRVCVFVRVSMCQWKEGFAILNTVWNAFFMIIRSHGLLQSFIYHSLLANLNQNLEKQFSIRLVSLVVEVRLKMPPSFWLLGGSGNKL